MKTILVPIDYSPCADNAVRYAIQIAKTIKASVHLCHSLLIPELIPMAGAVVWPVQDYSHLEEDAERALSAYVEKISKDEELNKPYLPTITHSYNLSSVKEMVDQIVETQQIDLIVMGTSGAGNMERLLLGSNSRAVVEKTNVPLLLIPKEAAYTAIDKIAFATDLSESDLNSIQAVARLFCLFNPEILLTHVHEEPSDLYDPSTKANQFLNRVTCNINYAKIYYRHLIETDIDKGLKWIIEHGQIDVLAMIHRHTGFLSRLLIGSHTQKMVRLTTLPLLVLPEDKQPIGW